MEKRFTIAHRLILCGTCSVLASLALMAFAANLSAINARDHRQDVVRLLDKPGVNNVNIQAWNVPGEELAWAGLVGGFLMVFTGTRTAMNADPTPEAAPKFATADEV